MKAAAPDKLYRVQVGAFKDKSCADALMRSLSQYKKPLHLEGLITFLKNQSFNALSSKFFVAVSNIPVSLTSG
ncbi:SPOR domain-containing protein [Peribacillus sp. SCS-155]|uniref:SPOR domain-containing protein n=1 Tax=Peribacillus sedimenti TaxID=3115297 RepID=UPI0039059C4E